MSNFVDVIRCENCKYRDEEGRCNQWPCWSFPNPFVVPDGYCYKAEKAVEAQHGEA